MRRLAALLLALASLSALAVAEASSGTAADGPVVAVLDTGVSLDGRVLAGIDLVAGDADTHDANGHGTAVAASVASACPSCRILPVRVLSDRGSAPWARVAAGIVWAVDHGARVVNVSIAGPGGSEALRQAVAYAAAHGTVVVAAAGNTASDEPQYPAAYPGVLAVGAAGSDWSARGSWVDVELPGCARLPVGGSRQWACGTSFAAPRAAGLVAQGLSPASAGRAPAPVVRTSGAATPGGILRAVSSRGSVHWFRCLPGASAHDCAEVSRSATYRVTPADAGSTLVARALTAPFGGLWLATSEPLAVRS